MLTNSQFLKPGDLLCCKNCAALNPGPGGGNKPPMFIGPTRLLNMLAIAATLFIPYGFPTVKIMPNVHNITQDKS